MASAGYSGTLLVRKIGIKAGHRVALVQRPADWELPELPDGVELLDRRQPGADVTVVFARTFADLAAEAPRLDADLADTAMLWIAWPRRAAGHNSDITENGLRELFLPLGLVDVKVAALGEDWSGLKLVRRRENRGR
ncbi:MAG TPA: DUF3052 domain-containing protein [Propionibacteriaceae bacterium]|jgi:hypothetical protein|nr:DUF3052 domain-containing protein [Propionibacteriaceae bacterium]